MKTPEPSPRTLTIKRTGRRQSPFNAEKTFRNFDTSKVVITFKGITLQPCTDVTVGYDPGDEDDDISFGYVAKKRVGDDDISFAVAPGIACYAPLAIRYMDSLDDFLDDE